MSDSGAPAEPNGRDEDPAPPSRPRPQYGEYATPAEVAAARGIPLDRGANEHVDRLATLMPPAAHPPKKQVAPLATPRAVPRPARARSGRSAAGARAGSPLLTVLLLVFGIWNTVSTIPTMLDFGPTISESFRLTGRGDVTFGPIAHTVGIVLLVISLLLTIGAVGLSFRRIRAGRPSLRVPLIAGLIWFACFLIGFAVIVANTPAAVALLQNHS